MEAIPKYRDTTRYRYQTFKNIDLRLGGSFLTLFLDFRLIRPFDLLQNFNYFFLNIISSFGLHKLVF